MSGPTGREWGEMTKEVEELRHDLRNMRTIVNHHSELVHELEVRLHSLNTKVYTAISITIVFASILGFAINLYSSI